MKRLTARLLALSLVLASFPAEAQNVLGRATVAGVGAPTPVPSGLAPAASFTAPSLAAPALALSAPLAAAAPAPIPLPLAVPAALAPAVPVALRAAPAPATTIQALKSAAAVPQAAAPVFDGARLAASAPDPVRPAPEAKTPKRSLLQRYKDSRKNTTPRLTAFAKGAFVASMAAVAAPPLLSMAPAMKAGYALAFADLALLATILSAVFGLWLGRKLRASPEAARPPPARVRTAAALALGLLFGAGLGVTPYYATGPVVENVQMYIDRNKAPEEREHIRWIRGGIVEEETVKVLSANPVGLDTLNALRDRFGVLRLPTFFISRQDDSHAQHENMFDGVYINENSILERGWTVEQFMKDPELQRRLIREIDSTVLHELTHAVQGRRPPWKPGYFTNTMEAEQEAFFQEVLYGVAKLEADPKATNNGPDAWLIIEAADDIDGFLKSVAQMYEKNVAIGNDPYFNAYMAEQRARWPAFRVRVYMLLSARATGPGSAKMYLEKARAAAKEAGLPDPAPASIASNVKR